MEKEKALEIIEQIAKINKEISTINKEDYYYLGNEFIDILQRNNIIGNKEVLNKVMGYFRATFENLSSNSVLLYNNGRESITIGKYGFGIRNYRQAKPVINFYNYQKLMKHKDNIIEKLNNKRKWNKADEFKIFSELDFDSFDSNHSVEIPLKKPVAILINEDTSTETILADKLSVNVLGVKTVILYLKTKEGLVEIENPKHIFTDDKISLLSNYILSDQLTHILGIFEKEIKEKSIKQKEILDILEKNFGKYIMMNNL